MTTEYTFGQLVKTNQGIAVKELGSRKLRPLSPELLLKGGQVGSIVQFAANQVPVGEFMLLAPPGSAKANIYLLAGKFGGNPYFSAAIQAETAQLLANPGLDDPQLQDYRDKPFCTIDGPDTRDLDQALFITETATGFSVFYALADAAYYVRPGSELFAEALRRGASFYLPGLMIPMLPRELCEGLISLNPQVIRRALVFELTLDKQGQHLATAVARAKIHSRGRLNFAEVNEFLQNGTAPFNPEPALQASLKALQTVGLLRMKLAEEHHVVRPHRTEVDVKLGEDGWTFIFLDSMRDKVEMYNEQISLLCNTAGARLLVDGDTDADGIQPIYKIHPEPVAEKLQAFEKMLITIVQERQLPPELWLWHRNAAQSLADYLESLPEAGPYLGLTKAIHRQAILINNRSEFSSKPRPHYGVGVDVYARFSAPMREMVGIFLHKELLEKLGLQISSKTGAAEDESLRAQVITAANRAQEIQKQMTKAANGMVLDQLFTADLKVPLAQRNTHSGYLLGLSRDRLYILLDQPTIELKVYLRYLETLWQVPLAVNDEQTGLLNSLTQERLLSIGDRLAVTVTDWDAQQNRWIFQIVPLPSL